MLTTASCEFPLLEKWKSLCSKNLILEIFDAVLSGYAQIAFNDNSFSGLLVILATYYGSPVQATISLWTTLIATITAMLIGVNRGLIRCGLYGFSAALTGLAIPLTIFPGCPINASMLLIAALAGVMNVLLTAALSEIFGKWNVSALSLPYCFTLLILIPGSLLFGNLSVTRSAPTLFALTREAGSWTFAEFMTASLNGLAQVLWVEKPLSGILYLAALALASRIDVITSLVGALVGTATAIGLGLPKDAILIGLYGYNAVLLMKVMTRGFKLSGRSLVLAICLAALTVPVACGCKVILAPLGMGTFAAFPYDIICIVVFIGRSKFANLTYVPGKYWGVPETIQSLTAEELKDYQ